MPELPEVETIRRTLSPRLAGRRVQAVTVHRHGQVRYPDVGAFRERLVGRSFGAVGRRGKYLLLPLTPGDDQLVCHLRMSGRLYLAPAGSPLATHTHVVFALDGDDELRYQDQRTFGGFHLVGPDGQGTPSGLQELGPEPFDAAWTPDYLAQRCRGRRAPIKAVLLDQRVVAGLGNIYVDELLFRAGTHPETPAGDLGPGRITALCTAAPAVLAEAIAHRGTTFSLYFDGEGAPGDFYQHLRVFDRSGQACYTCGEKIQKRRTAGRGTHFCPRCQPGG